MTNLTKRQRGVLERLRASRVPLSAEALESNMRTMGSLYCRLLVDVDTSRSLMDGDHWYITPAGCKALLEAANEKAT